jgi:ATP-binding cassette subfamily B multidrug efflux pump
MTRPQTAAPPPAPAPRRQGPPMGGPGRFMAGGMPPEKPLNFRGSLLRLLRMLRPERALIVALLLFGVASVTLSVLGPKLRGKATDLIFAGVIGSHPPGGQSMLNRLNVVPGGRIDFNAVGRVLLLVLVIYVVASLFALLQARLTNRVVQRSVYRLR